MLTGIAHNTAGTWMTEIVMLLVDCRDEWISLPVTDEELKALAEGFASFGLSRLLNCVSAIDGTHIEYASKHLCDKNYKEFYSLNNQVICDCGLYIRHVYSGCAGCYSDKTMYRESGIQKWVQYISKKNVLDVEGVPVGYYVVGDGIYNLRPGLMTPLNARNHPLSPSQEEWELRHSSCRQVIEQCFGIMKGRWNILQSFKTLRYPREKVHHIFLACCVLHNFCLYHEEVWPRQDMVDHRHGCRYEGTDQGGFMGLAEQPDLDLARLQRVALTCAMERAHREAGE
jgi:hypothetical protein